MIRSSLEAREARAGAPAHLFEGAEWDFPTMQRVYEAVQDDRARTISASTSFPTRSR